MEKGIWKPYGAFDRKKKAPSAAQLAAEERIAAEIAAEHGDAGRPMEAPEATAYKTWKAKTRRARFPQQLPPPPVQGDVEVLYALRVPELQDINDGEKVQLLLSTRAWQATVGAECERIDAAGDSRRAYSAAELEAVILYQRLNGKRTYKAARERLTSDRGRDARIALGFHRPRDHVRNRRCHHPHRRRLDGVPSEATVCRHRTKRFPEALRAELYHECFKRLVEEHAQEFPEFCEELRVLGWDGSTQKSVFRPGQKRRRNPKTGETEYLWDENGEPVPRIQGWEGGTMTNPSAPLSKRGHGFLTVTGHTGTGLPVAMRTGRIEEEEAKFVVDMLENDVPRWRRFIGADKLGVSSLDGAFAKPKIRRAHRKAGYIENTHLVSHGYHEAAKRHLAETRETVYGIEGAPNWRVDGLRQPFCMCGNGTVAHRFNTTLKGEARASIECACDKCGSVSLKSGDWRLVKNPSQFVRINPNDNADVEDADMALGNPLTFDNPKAALYGKNRYAQGEGLHGHATTRFNIFKDRAYIKRLDQARLDVLLPYCLMHALAMETRRRRGQGLPSKKGRGFQLIQGRGAPPPSAPPGAIAA